MNTLRTSMSESVDERREQIKRAALKVFAKQGLTGAKMSSIAAEAGISQGLSYRYFSSKEEIFTMLVQEALEEAQSAIQDLQNLPGSPKDKLKAFTQRMLDESQKAHFMLIQVAMTSEDIPAQAKEWLTRYSAIDTIGQFVPLFKQGQEIGEFVEGEPQRLLFLYFSVVTGLMLQDTPASPGYWMKEVDMLLKIIAKEET
ncbi:TetR/AcrR family transcriptional regulator [Paenibacillus hexagrammi]|uniref:TetR/AcrR family transcriptional regulator n=1 Tax=Paenibacillus hexagrammi TaxID=2908839 RepID=A0ABY3SCK6_9BACL|nr:TetR/AcrR family transcriptional regulator [Paenibacillus sp. YPD9-1]UJF31676.1 TetR/AcrR family transcriptional regulator [Paenibacillus sp. YPD9-1]